MENPFAIFEHEQFGKIRVALIDGEPWFVGNDVAKALGYAKPWNALNRHVVAQDKTVAPIQGIGSRYKTKATIVNESGLYSLVLASCLPDAQKFKHWVTAEVLPSIRKTGSYSTDLFNENLSTPAAKIFPANVRRAEERDFNQPQSECLILDDKTWSRLMDLIDRAPDNFKEQLIRQTVNALTGRNIF